ncbi:MAG: hypothetical protein EXS13_07595, partial [Planctomycetes bacterium]|nr:hypothetical protein [Planctomycetota bacterium]
MAERPIDCAKPPVRGTAWRSTLFWGVALVILALDLWSKQRVFAWLGVDPSRYKTLADLALLPPSRTEPIAGTWLKFRAILNPGMMWGAFQEYSEELRIVRPLAVLVIFFLLSSLPAGQWGARLALGGILGGAIGNIWDSFCFLGV